MAATRLSLDGLQAHVKWEFFPSCCYCLQEGLLAPVGPFCPLLSVMFSRFPPTCHRWHWSLSQHTWVSTGSNMTSNAKISLSLWNESDRCNGFQSEGLTSDAILEKQSKPKLNCRIHFILKNKKNVAFWWNLCQYGVGATWELQVACVAAFTASCFKGLLMLTWSEIRRRSHLDLSFPPHQIYWLPTITPGYPSSGESGVNWQ